MLFLLKSIAFPCIMIGLLGCRNSDNEPEPDASELIFHSGFEASVVGIPETAHLDLIGKDLTLIERNDWELNLDAHPDIGDFSFQYEGGNESERHAQLRPDPNDTQNTVLHFWLQHANVEQNGVKTKGRVQSNIYHNQNLTEIYQRIKLYLPDDFELLKQAPTTIGWLTLFEFWNNPEWISEGLGFRISVDIKKLDATVNTPLTLGIHGQVFENDRYQSIWQMDNSSFTLPIDSWMDIEIYFKEGNEHEGRFIMTVATQEGPGMVVFDITNFTHHPNDPNPDGLSHFNPMKLYTSKGLIDYVRDNGKSLQVYWDDFELWKNKKP